MSKAWPSSLEEACDNWLFGLGSYTQRAKPPLGPATAADFHALDADLKSAVMYYDANQPFQRVMQYASMRLPCGTKISDVNRMRTNFGIDQSFYNSLLGYSESFGGPPMCGVYTRTEVTVFEKSFKLSVYHMIAPDMNHTLTADFLAVTKQGRDYGLITGQYISQSDTDVLVHLVSLRHALMWYMAFVAARDHGFHKIADVSVGSGAFCPSWWKERFHSDVHNAAFFHLGYGTEEFEKEFPGIRLVDAPKAVPKSLNEDMDDILHINPWDHSSFIGNSNVEDPSINGGWGCIGRFAPLGWPYSNPYLRWRAVKTDELEKSFSTDLPKGGLCGKPHETLLAQREKAGGDGGGSSSAPPPQAENRDGKRPRVMSRKARALNEA